MAGNVTHEREELLRQLRGQLGCSVATPRLAEEAIVFSAGAAAIDRLLPGGGLRHGMLVEWLAERPGCGAATLGLLAAREACRSGGVLVVVDRARMFYPPAAVGWGVDPERLVVVRPRTARDEIWAAVQSLRSPVVAAVWAMIDRLDGRNFRRLQLAAEAGGTLGVLVRGASARGQPSWADVRLSVGIRQGDRETRRQGDKSGQRVSSPRRVFDSSPLLLVSLSRSRGGRSGGSACIEIDEAAHEVREVEKAVSDRLSAAGQQAWPIADSRQPKVSSHVPHPLPVVAQLVDSAVPAHSARA